MLYVYVKTLIEKEKYMYEPRAVVLSEGEIIINLNRKVFSIILMHILLCFVLPKEHSH